MTSTTILVTGGSGLIGQRLLHRLRAAGRPCLGIDIIRKPQGEAVEIADLDDVHALHRLTRAHGVGSIIHCGGISGPMVMIDNPHAIIRTNVGGTANMLEVARLHGLRRLVFCSSTSAYGPTMPPSAVGGIPEDVPLRPGSVYASTKAAAEALLVGYRTQHALDAVAIRLSWVYGPGRTTDCVIRTMVEGWIEGRPVRLPYGGDFPRQFIHVDDAVDALLAAHDAPACPRAVYTATGDSFLTIGEIAAVASACLPGAVLTVEDGPDPLDDVQHRFDISAIRRDLGFAPRRSLAEGIADYAAWLRERMLQPTPKDTP